MAHSSQQVRVGHRSLFASQAVAASVDVNSKPRQESTHDPDNSVANMHEVQARDVSKHPLADKGMGGMVVGANIAGLNDVDVTGEGAVGVESPQPTVLQEIAVPAHFA